jgi:Ca-activated chloride channel family protein
MDKMIARGPGYLSAAVVYENLVVESYARNTGVPIVAVYPTEGTFWADHPWSVLDAPYVGAPERDAAAALYTHLRSRPAQERALGFGFRPADPKVATGAPVDAAHGADPKQPQTILPIPTRDVLEKLPSVWAATKRGADVVIVFDKSGSMGGPPLAAAKAGAKAFVATLPDRDEVAFAPFDDKVYPPRGPYRLGAPGARQRLAGDIDMTSANGGTSLYDAIATAHDNAMLRARETPSIIHGSW